MYMCLKRRSVAMTSAGAAGGVRLNFKFIFWGLDPLKPKIDFSTRIASSFSTFHATLSLNGQGRISSWFCLLGPIWARSPTKSYFLTLTFEPQWKWFDMGVVVVPGPGRGSKTRKTGRPGRGSLNIVIHSGSCSAQDAEFDDIGGYPWLSLIVP